MNNKLFFIILLLFFHIGTSLGNQSKYIEVTKQLVLKGSIQYKNIEDIASIIRSDNDLNHDEKLLSLINLLDSTEEYISEDEYVKLVKNSEIILLTITSNPDVGIDQALFLIGNLNKPSYKNPLAKLSVFSISDDEILNKVESISEIEKCTLGFINCYKLKDVPFVNGYLSMIKTRYFLDKGNIEEARKNLPLIFEGIKVKPDELLEADEIAKKHFDDNQKLIIYIAHMLKYRIAEASSSFDVGIEDFKYVSENFNEVIEILKRTEESNGKIYGDFRFAYEMDLYLGKYKEAISKARTILINIPEDTTNREFVNQRAAVMKDLTIIYTKIGLNGIAKKYSDQSFENDLIYGRVDPYIIGNQIVMTILNGEYEKTEKYINFLEEKGCPILTPSSEKNECMEYANEFRKFYANIKNSKNDQDKKVAQNNFQLSSIDMYEKVLTERKLLHSDNDNFGYDLQLMIDYELLYNAYSNVSNQIMAAFYAKQYINILQKLRSEINIGSEQNLNVFTIAHSDNLKRFSNTFYDVNDYNAAWSCSRIIKENEFMDFVRRRGVDKKFLTTINFNDIDNDYIFKYNLLLEQLDSLKTQLVKSVNSDGRESIKNEIDVKFEEFKNLRNDYVKKSQSKIIETRNSKQNNSLAINLKANEAAIQYLIQEKSLTILVSTLIENKKFEINIDRISLRRTLLELQKKLSQKEHIDNNFLKNISNQIISAPLTYLENKKINKIKISPDDLISSIPFSILKYKGIDIGKTYEIELIGLSNNAQVNQENQTLNAFGASQGNNEFSTLPGVKIELDVLKSFDTDIKKITLYLDRDFNRPSFVKSFEKNTSIVHVATHFRLEGNLASSNTMLLGDGTTISLEELQTAIPNINSNLVTLSACNTGNILGSSKSIEGLTGIFQTKGANNIVSTLWEIDDQATADFMAIFYSILLHNKISPSNALFHTQNIFREGNVGTLPNNIVLKKNKLVIKSISNLSNYSHPFFWSGFQVSTVYNKL